MVQVKQTLRALGGAEVELVVRVILEDEEAEGACDLVEFLLPLVGGREP